MEKINQEQIMKEIEEKSEKETQKLMHSENGKKFKNRLYQKMYDTNESNSKDEALVIGKDVVEIMQKGVNEFQKKTGKQGLTYSELRLMFG
jgi:hypothetical protein